MMTRQRPRNQLRVTALLAALAIAATMWGATDASALSLSTLRPGAGGEGGCKVANAANISQSWDGAASTNGYTVSPLINAVSGELVIPTNTVSYIDLPPNGVVCVSSMRANGTSNQYHTLRFRRNEANTPVYLLVEGDAKFNYGVRIELNGAAPTTRYGIGMDRVGGMGAPGGSDGGSCDFTFSDPNRAGGGMGPGGGSGSAVGGGGDGASPVRDGDDGNTGAAGGAHYSEPEHRILHGGSGGGCGSNGAATPAYNGGGGGGGVFVLAAGGEITFYTYYTHYESWIHAQGGNASYGGDGAGGVVRLIADKISGPSTSTYSDFFIDVRGGGSKESNAGLIKLESPDVSGYFLNHLYPSTAVYYGAQQEIFPDDVPELKIVSVEADYGDPAVRKTVTRTESDPSRHIHTVPGVFLEAPSSPLHVVTVNLWSNHVPHDATIYVRMNTVYEEKGTGPTDPDYRWVYAATVDANSTGSGMLSWEANLTVPPDMELGAIEAWVENIQ